MSCFCAQVAAVRLAAALRVGKDLARETVEKLVRAILRSVVDDDHLDQVFRVFLREYRFETLCKLTLPVFSGDNDRDGRGVLSPPDRFYLQNASFVQGFADPINLFFAGETDFPGNISRCPISVAEPKDLNGPRAHTDHIKGRLGDNDVGSRLFFNRTSSRRR